MELNMKESGKIILLVDMEFIIFQIKEPITVVGKIKKKKDLENLFGLIENISDFI